MGIQDIVDELVEERSLDALERLTGSQNEEVLEALVDAAGQLIGAEDYDETEDRIVEAIRIHLVDSRAVGVLTDALSHREATVREFALACLGEIGDKSVVPDMIRLLEDKDRGVREAAGEHLALLTSYDLGADPVRWREWHQRLVAGQQEQAVEDKEDQEKLLRLQLRGRRTEEGEAEAEAIDEDAWR